MIGGGGLADRLAQQIDVANNEQILGLVHAQATLERNRRSALAAHLEALDVDADVPDLPDHEERVDELVALIEARIAGDPWDYWVEWQAPDALDNAAQAREYAGMESDEWEDRIATWAGVYREKFEVPDDLTDRDLAGHHVEDQFGLTLDEFEETVVEWRAAEVLERAAAGPHQDMTEAVVDATAALEASDQ
ncbi:hypothetical protein [Halorarius litoreus]|uniref:hypothetical protein n=1 Tax=Halorarius litoreus TaxID=2962676 RepID=UPI0020CFD0D8|nr:hypothetical protein [Halorarius litoreus]